MTDAAAKSILVNIFNHPHLSNTLKVAIIDEFTANVDPSNASFQLNWNALKQALDNNDVSNSQLENIISNAIGCHNCIKFCMFP